MPEIPADEQTTYEVFHDLQGRSYTCDLATPLGGGGQGIVLRVRDDAYSAVKIQLDNTNAPCRDTECMKAFTHKLHALRRLPIPVDCRISLPVALLKDVAGYVMRLLGEVRPLRDMLPRTPPTTKDPMPQWIKMIVEDECTRSFIHFYSRSGGLRTRLQILLQLAETLAALHGEGLLFGDISPNNVVLVGSVGEVWLIDTDNIAYDGQSRDHICTPEFGPPEIARGEAPVSIAGDAYSFALLAFETLTMCHPFKGVVGKNVDAAERVERGELPWICDHEDDSNRCEPIDHAFSSWTLTPPLFRLFAAMFEKGRLSPAERPQIWMFHDALARALDTCIRCPACGMGRVYAELSEHTCMFCDTAYPPILVAEVGACPVFAHEVEADFVAPWRIFGPEKRDGHALRFTWGGGRLCVFPGGEPGDIDYSLDGASFRPCPTELELDPGQAAGGVRLVLRGAGSPAITVRLREA